MTTDNHTAVFHDAEVRSMRDEALYLAITMGAVTLGLIVALAVVFGSAAAIIGAVAVFTTLASAVGVARWDSLQ